MSTHHVDPPQPPAADERLELAYNAVLATLARQDATLTTLRNRAAAILSVAALLTSFSAGVGLVQSDRTKPHPFPTWAGYTLIGLIVAMAIATLVVLWPVGEWTFGAGAQLLLDRSAQGKSLDIVREETIVDLLVCKKENDGEFAKRMIFYKAALLLLPIEVVVVLAGAITS